MTALYREFVLKDQSVWKTFVAFIQANVSAMKQAGTPLRLIVTSAETKRNAEQNKRYWGFVLKTIAEQAWVEGARRPQEAPEGAPNTLTPCPPSRHLPRPHPPLVVTTLWAFTDFTSENGATRFVRGSHRFAETPDRPGALDGHEIECFEAPAGSVMERVSS